jgi:hypothetical protein
MRVTGELSPWRDRSAWLGYKHRCHRAHCWGDPAISLRNGMGPLGGLTLSGSIQGPDSHKPTSPTRCSTWNSHEGCSCTSPGTPHSSPETPQRSDRRVPPWRPKNAFPGLRGAHYRRPHLVRIPHAHPRARCRKTLPRRIVRMCEWTAAGSAPLGSPGVIAKWSTAGSARRPTCNAASVRCRA